MAEKLSATNVHVLAPRKAKGAKSTGGKARKPRLIPAAHEKPPRATRTPRPAPASAQPSDADIRRGQQDRLIALHTRHRAVDNRLDVAAAAIADIKLDKKEVRAAIQNAGFPLALYDEAYLELKLKTKRIDLEAKEKIRGLIREALGLPAGPQATLLDNLPEAAKPAVFWRDVGFREGVNGDGADADKAGVPPENLQDYLEGHGEASAHNARGIKALEQDAPERDAEPLVPAGDKPFWHAWPLDYAQWTDAQTEQFTNWYKGLGDEEVDITHAGAEAMFDVLLAAEDGPVADEFV